MNYEETLNYIESIARFGSNLGLDRTEKMLEILGNPHKRIKAVHVAGTNGKGSIAAMISKILMEDGLKVGMYTSPYLEVFEERIQINGVNIPRDDLSRVVTKVSEVVKKVIEMGYDNPTEFEIITCAMFYYFAEQNVDIAVVEVGLGGRLDSTNVMPPFSEKQGGGVMLSIISSISYDHMKILGNTLGKIAYEKAGIIKPGIPVIMYPEKEEAGEVIEQVCRQRGSQLIKVPENSVRRVGEDKINNCSEKYTQHINLNTQRNSYDIELSLLGKHQLLNCAVSVFAVEQLSRYGIEINKSIISKALKKVKWMGRLEVMAKNPLVVIDGAHNREGISMLKDNMESYFSYNRIVLVLGILADKEVDIMVRTIVPLAWRVIAVTPNNSRAEDSKKLKSVVEKYNLNCEAFEDYESAYSRALSYCKKDDLLLVSGSLYMIGGMRKIIREYSVKMRL
ncbi:MAG TPA: bifunctional folylpolyglutamate synthase/dihydrofolate synthase [Clostridium sp.]|jgi:dihydrofolate synthase/folylpolyglutamate synthase|uniref:tetrahydrofolate synthase n=1 Tax=Clostridium lapidicellarium TaxID=3240931 RepID=A0ABV4DZV5_9CLOT|nr:folylpolyglutamate synthase/dihydrofolate synthase family protein [uncultured Clostridium sp.]NLU07547.1 bifunctional folylpolyglutamate synthase/dihydrofolate synthase [Clostridiales bacterium]HBC95191.1 bifunctional folylpolyglutamate synthase/dihydrofolate synthase [Clostridium sp.]